MKKHFDISERGRAVLKLVSSMLIFGTVGLFVKGCAYPSGFIAMTRGFIGALLMLVIMLISKRRPDVSAIRDNLVYLLLSGAFIGFNWILLFESYRYTTVAAATLMYYMAPIFVTLLSPMLLGTRLNPKRILCIITAVFGMALLSEFWRLDFGSRDGYLGIILALSAALLYALVTLTNKKMREISSEDRTLTQLLVAAVVVLPYTLICEDVSAVAFDPRSILLLILIGALHTGIAYSLYFGSISALPADTVAVFSYIDPISAVILSVIFLDESMSIFGIIGAVLILLSAYLLDRAPKTKENKTRGKKGED